MAFQTTYQGKKATQAILRDITERKQSEKKIHHLAYYDAVTGLSNRNFLGDYLKEALMRSQDSNQILAVMFLDLDRFKLINDTFGHSFGDALLQQVAARLRKCLRENSMISRYGGDEYIIVLGQTNIQEICRLAGDEFMAILSSVTSHDAIQVAERIMAALQAHVIILGNEVIVTPSIGIALYPEHGTTPETLVKRADAAMYQAKQSGKNMYYMFH